jgi:hypothetical protein
MGDYGLVNELIKFIWKNTNLDIFLTYTLHGKKSSMQQKMTHVKTCENEVYFNHSKVHNYILVKIL